MTLDDLEKGLWGLGAAAISLLVGAVRHGDVKRIDKIEAHQQLQDQEATRGRERISEEIQQLRAETQGQHQELVRLIVGRRE